MIALILLGLTALVTVAQDMAAPLQSQPESVYDLCQRKTLQLRTVGETGYIKFDNSSLSKDANSGLGCVQKIESCGACQIELEPVVEDNRYFTFFCGTGTSHSKYCSLGCDHLNIFDMYYMNETRIFYTVLGQKSTTFQSESSKVFIMLCHGGNDRDYRFKIRYKTIKKLKTILGSSDTSSATGMISSPYFPLGYAQNKEVYEYILSSPSADDYIQLTFDDWHLSKASILYFMNSNRNDKLDGESSRPVIISDSNVLKFNFSTGSSLTAGENRDYMGFQAAYKFYSKRSYIKKPNTDCKGQSYLMSSIGGRITFSPSSPTRELYDCLWVVKTQEGFDGTYLKVVKLRSNAGYLFRGDNQLTIRAGISSVAPVRSIFDMLDNIDNGIPHFSPRGFYIRLNASLSSSDSVILAYASYKEAGSCSGLFVCENTRCIDKSLMCDGYDQCGDNSDEISGCSGNADHWDKSYQYTITIGVIVPMVISVFLIMVICLLFVMIRRCRRARLRELRESSERLPTVSEDVSGRRRRRRHRRRLGLFSNAERDLPPTYDEAIQNPPGWYLNVAFGNPVDPTLPQPPSYHEATGLDSSGTCINTDPPVTPGSPTSTDSSQSEVTVCSGNISDSSSSSDGESWGMYNGDGDGRRGRLGRHVSSSESEIGTTERPGRSAATSPEQSEPVATSVTNSTETSHDRRVTVEETQNVESAPKLDKNSEILVNKDRDKKVNDESDRIVVPVGPKPGSTNLQINDCRPKVNSQAMTHDLEPHGQPKFTSPKVSAVSHSHRRNVSSGSETTMENIKKPKKKPRKLKSKKTSNQNVTSDRSGGYDYTQHISNEGASNIPDIATCKQENPLENPESSVQRVRNHDIPRSDESIESRPEVSPMQQDNGDLVYQVVVNVDNDNVIVVYDSDDKNNQEKFPSSNVPVAVPVEEATSSAIQSECNDKDQNCLREPAVQEYELKTPANGDQEPDSSKLKETNYDLSVKSGGYENEVHVRGKSDAVSGGSEHLTQADVQSRSASGSNDLTNQSYISLNSDLSDMNDIYV